jgi:hypothetical protein
MKTDPIRFSCVIEGVLFNPDSSPDIGERTVHAVVEETIEIVFKNS